MRKLVAVAVLILVILASTAAPAAAASKDVSIGAMCAKAGNRSQTTTKVPTVCVKLTADKRLTWHTASAVAVPRQAVAACSGAYPVVCHYNVGTGFYNLSVDLIGTTSILVETRRQVLGQSGSGRAWRFDATVSVRNPEGQPTGSEGFGSPGLSIAFAGNPTILSIRISAVTPPLSIFLVGDSTVADLEQVHAPKTGWGQEIPQYFGPGAAIANYGDSGESAQSYLAKPELFNTLERQIPRGAVVLIQFGHNDKAESAAAYRGYLAQMIARVRARGATAVLVTPPVMRTFAGASLTPAAMHISGGINYPAEMTGLATEQHVPLIDLTTKSRVLVESLGVARSAPLYTPDNVHPTAAGATQLAALVIAGLRALNLVPTSYFRS